MINIYEVFETNKMIEKENLDVRTITMGINLLDCADSNLDVLCQNIYDKICRLAKDLVKTGEDISREFGIPIVNKRIAITPISLVGGSACKTPDDYVKVAKALDRAAKTVGVNFLGGYSAVVSKGMSKSDELLIRSIPKALAETDFICSSINVGSTKTGINMDAVKLMGEIVKQTAEATKERASIGCAQAERTGIVPKGVHNVHKRVARPRSASGHRRFQLPVAHLELLCQPPQSHGHNRASSCAWRQQAHGHLGHAFSFPSQQPGAVVGKDREYRP